MLVAELYMNPTVSGRVVEPLDVVGAETVEFSVFTHVIVWATAVASRICMITGCIFTAEVVVKVIVSVAAELLVTMLFFEVTGIVAALAVAVIALAVVMTCENVCVPVNVWAASVRASVADVVGKVIVVESVPDKVSVFVTESVFAFVRVNVPVVAVSVMPL